eukprot:139533-Prorocentrum_minimum.AAC.1
MFIRLVTGWQGRREVPDSALAGSAGVGGAFSPSFGAVGVFGAEGVVGAGVLAAAGVVGAGAAG